MIKKCLVIALLSLFALPIFAEDVSEAFLPIGASPVVKLSQESSEVRILPSLNFYEGVTVTPTDDPNTFCVESGLLYDDLPIYEVYLDDDVVRPSVILPSNMFNSPMAQNKLSNSITNRSVFSKQAYIGESSRSAARVNGYATETAGNFSFGAGYNRGLDKAQMEDNTSAFARYDTGRFALNSQYIASSKQHLGTQVNSFKISPEVKLTDQLKIRTGFQSYTNVPLKKGEVVLVYSPSIKKYLDSLSFEVGVAQRYNTSTGVRGSEVRFSTGFRL